MNKNINEELPARKFASPQNSTSTSPASAKSNTKGSSDLNGNGKLDSFEKKVRQAVYDIRYRARREEVPLRTAFSQYLQNSTLGAKERLLVKQKLFGKSGMQEDFDILDVASNSVASAMFKVFVDGYSIPEESDIVGDYIQELNALPDKKYKVRVTDKNSKKSYVRYATREKIAQLRANPNIESVELTEYGEPYEGEKKRGEQTAAVKAGKDYDGDGKVESGAKEYRGAVHNAIQRRKGGTPDGRDTSSVKEDFIRELNDSKPKKYDIKGSKDKPNNIVLMPKESSVKEEASLVAEASKSRTQQKFMGMVYARKKGKMKKGKASPEVEAAAKGMTKTEAKKYAKTKHKGLPVHVEEMECGMKGDVKKPDTRGNDAKINMIKNKFRAMGIQNPVVMAASYEPEGEQIDEFAGALVKGALAAGGLWAASKGMEGLKKKADEKINSARKDWKIGGDRRVPQNNSYESEKEMVEQRRPYYRTTSDGRKVRWDEDESIDDAISR
jgi:hypothetical protein